MTDVHLRLSLKIQLPSKLSFNHNLNSMSLSITGRPSRMLTIVRLTRA